MELTDVFLNRQPSELRFTLLHVPTFRSLSLFSAFLSLLGTMGYLFLLRRSSPHPPTPLWTVSAGFLSCFLLLLEGFFHNRSFLQLSFHPTLFSYLSVYLIHSLSLLFSDLLAWIGADSLGAAPGRLLEILRAKLSRPNQDGPLQGRLYPCTLLASSIAIVLLLLYFSCQISFPYVVAIPLRLPERFPWPYLSQTALSILLLSLFYCLSLRTLDPSTPTLLRLASITSLSGSILYHGCVLGSYHVHLISTLLSNQPMVVHYWVKLLLLTLSCIGSLYALKQHTGVKKGLYLGVLVLTLSTLLPSYPRRSVPMIE